MAPFRTVATKSQVQPKKFRLKITFPVQLVRQHPSHTWHIQYVLPHLSQTFSHDLRKRGSFKIACGDLLVMTWFIDIGNRMSPRQSLIERHANEVAFQNAIPF